MTIGIDVVDVARFEAVLERNPAFAARFFTEEERSHTRLAGTFAAKEAVMKALGLTPAPAWARRVRITRQESGRPTAQVDGFPPVQLSISHDGGVAVAVALAA